MTDSLSGTLRLLATSDLHTQIMPWDYLADVPCPGRGLARLATLIARARAEVPDCVLLDNGDFLQGSPLGDLVAAAGIDGIHPMIAAMNALGYDAATLGNHEFSHGLPFLDRSLRDATFPIVSANIFAEPGHRPFVAPFTVLTRMLTLGGQTHPLRIGVMGFAPPQLVTWDHQHLAGAITTEDILTAAHRTLPLLRATGVDLVIALSHSGIGDPTPLPGTENASAAVAALPGVDVLVAGHTHLTFPPADAPDATLSGTPAVMPGFFGSHLGVIDLTLTRDDAGWHVVDHRSRLWPIARRAADGQVAPLVSSDAAIEAIAAPAHTATLAWARQRIGHNTARLHSYFSLIRACASVRVVSRAQTAHVTRALAGTAFAGLPILSAAAPFRAGGRGGPENYSHIGVGDLAMRHISDLYIHPNTVTALQISGSELAAWLEQSASLYHRIRPGERDQMLIDPDFPSFNFDNIDGVTYRIDLSRPSRHDAQGAIVNPGSHRITDLRHDGAPVAPDARFVLATNSYRTGGSGNFPGARPDRVIYASGRLNTDVLLDHIVAQGGIPAPGPANWGFVPMPGTSVLVDTSPHSARFTDDQPQGTLKPLGLMPDGFLRYRLHL